MNDSLQSKTETAESIYRMVMAGIIVMTALFGFMLASAAF